MNPQIAFRERAHAHAFLQQIQDLNLSQPLRLMEVCGGHTMAIWRHGLPSLLGDKITLLSGPGCPVCVTPNSFMDRAIALSRLDKTIVVTFGDLLRVPGSSSSLQIERARGADIRPVYSSRDALPMAAENPDGTVVFLGIGFETTAPTIAATLIAARERGLENFRLLSALKTMPAALRAIASGEDLRLDGLILPGHVSAITGSGIYGFLAEEFHLPGVISGFEPLDLLQGIFMLAQQKAAGRAEIQIQYRRFVQRQGNLQAQTIMNQVFEPYDTEWRGLGRIGGSGLRLREEFRSFDAVSIPVQVEPAIEPAGCRCPDVIRGALQPQECPLFGKTCVPEQPVGACMVSEEGSCAAHYRFRSLETAGLQ